LMSIALVVATQAKGTVLIHEKMYDGRLDFVDKLVAMGAQVILCDPHRAVVVGPSQLTGHPITSPDIRAGMALVLAALAAKGKTTIGNSHQIDRGYPQPTLTIPGGSKWTGKMIHRYGKRPLYEGPGSFWAESDDIATRYAASLEDAGSRKIGPLERVLAMESPDHIEEALRLTGFKPASIDCGDYEEVLGWGNDLFSRLEVTNTLAMRWDWIRQPIDDTSHYEWVRISTRGDNR